MTLPYEELLQWRFNAVLIQVPTRVSAVQGAIDVFREYRQSWHPCRMSVPAAEPGPRRPSSAHYYQCSPALSRRPALEHPAGTAAGFPRVRGITSQTDDICFRDTKWFNE